MLKFRRILFFVIVSEFNCILNFIRASSIVNDIKKRKREKFLSMIPKQIGSFSLILKNSEIESSIRTHDYITKTPRHTFYRAISSKGSIHRPPSRFFSPPRTRSLAAVKSVNNRQHAVSAVYQTGLNTRAMQALVLEYIARIMEEGHGRLG